MTLLPFSFFLENEWKKLNLAHKCQMTMFLLVRGLQQCISAHEFLSRSENSIHWGFIFLQST